jgi:hypothetical protein
MAPQFRSLALLLLSLLSPLALGADKVPWYQVEIIVFARPNASIKNETWPVEAKTPLAGRELTPWRGYSGPESTPFQLLPATALQMKKEFDRMRAAGEVEPILHTAWLQPGLAREEAVAIHLKSEGSNAGWVDGSMRLVLSRYLHLETNLIYHRAGEDATQVGRPVYQLVESRRMRSREYHYLDHPLFGVLAVVTPYEPKPATPAGSR